MDVGPPTPAQDRGRLVRREVVQDQVQPLRFRIALANALQDVQDLAASLPRPEVAPELIGMDVVARQPVPDPVGPRVGRGESIGMALWPPALARLGPEFQWAKLVEGQRGSIPCPLVHVPPNQFF